MAGVAWVGIGIGEIVVGVTPVEAGSPTAALPAGAGMTTGASVAGGVPAVSAVDSPEVLLSLPQAENKKSELALSAAMERRC